MWREPEPKRDYDIVIVGGGGHGLATAFYLASRYGMANIAVLEKAGLGQETLVETLPLYGPIIFLMETSLFMNSRLSYGRAWSRS